MNGLRKSAEVPSPGLVEKAIWAARINLEVSQGLAALGEVQLHRRATTAAASALQRETALRLTQACALLKVRDTTVSHARAAARATFVKAEAAAREAIREAIKAGGSLPVAASPPPAVATPARVVTFPPIPRARPASPAPAVSPPSPPSSIRSYPPGAGQAVVRRPGRFELRPGGVEVRRIRAVSAAVVRYATPAARKGADLSELAAMFNVDADALRQALETAGAI